MKKNLSGFCTNYFILKLCKISVSVYTVVGVLPVVWQLRFICNARLETKLRIRNKEELLSFVSCPEPASLVTTSTISEWYLTAYRTVLHHFVSQ
jgi:hypothetical protein